MELRISFILPFVLSLPKNSPMEEPFRFFLMIPSFISISTGKNNAVRFLKTTLRSIKLLWYLIIKIIKIFLTNHTVLKYEEDCPLFIFNYFYRLRHNTT